MLHLVRNPEDRIFTRHSSFRIELKLRSSHPIFYMISGMLCNENKTKSCLTVLQLLIKFSGLEGL